MRGKSEQPPYTDERIVAWLAFGSWLAASAVVVGVASRRRRLPIAGLWVLQSGLLSVAALHTSLSPSGYGIDSSLLVAGIGGQILGLVAIGLGTRAVPRPSPSPAPLDP